MGCGEGSETGVGHSLGLLIEQMEWQLLRYRMQEEDQCKEERFIFRHAELRCQWSTQMEVCGR